MFGFRLTQDLRYIVSVSNKFITWDLSTSDLTREVIPGIEGIMQDLVLSPDNKYSIAHTNNSQVGTLKEESVRGVNSFPSSRFLLCTEYVK